MAVIVSPSVELRCFQIRQKGQGFLPDFRKWGISANQIEYKEQRPADFEMFGLTNGRNPSTINPQKFRIYARKIPIISSGKRADTRQVRAA